MADSINRKDLAVGIIDYQKLVLGGYYYVDKTLLIAQVWRNAEVTLMPRPRRFGKTLNLSMMRYFFEKSTAHSPIDHEVLFGTSKLLRDYPEYRALMGKYPVIFLTFKDIVHQTWERAYERFCDVIGKEFIRHNYVLESLGSGVDKEKYIRICESRASYVECASSLLFLSEVLHNYHKQKVVVLIDEYDAPMHAGYSSNYYESVVNFARSLLSEVLKDNIHIERGFLTGILSIAKNGIYSGLNNILVLNVLDERAADCFGFTQKEVEELAGYYDLTEHLPAMKAWYDGYRIGNEIAMYNPWSVVHCINNKGRADIYWVNTSQDEPIKRLLARAPGDFKVFFEALLAGEKINKPINQSIVMSELDYDEESRLLWSLLLYAGYLTYSGITVMPLDIEYTLLVPNREIMQLLHNLIRSVFVKVIRPEAMRLFREALADGEVQELTILMGDFIAKSVSVLDIPIDETERSYHLFVLGMLVSLQDFYEVKSNRESGGGRYDIMMIPRQKELLPIIIEFKSSSTFERLSKAAHDALKQIKDKNYAQDLKDRGFNTHRAYGMAFYRKDVLIVMDSSE